MNPQALILATVVVAVVILASLYATCNLNAYLPANMAKSGCPTASGFIGAYARVPEMQNCLAYSGAYRRDPYFNRCTWC